MAQICTTVVSVSTKRHMTTAAVHVNVGGYSYVYNQGVRLRKQIIFYVGRIVWYMKMELNFRRDG